MPNIRLGILHGKELEADETNWMFLIVRNVTMPPLTGRAVGMAMIVLVGLGVEQPAPVALSNALAQDQLEKISTL